MAADNADLTDASKAKGIADSSDAVKVAASLFRTRGQAIRIVIIGKTGTGKSSTANTILGEEKFLVQHGICSGNIQEIKLQETEKHGVKFQVVDTPGVCDTYISDDDVVIHICKSVAATAPGPHAILMCVRCDHRFTEDEFEAYRKLKKVFGGKLVDYMILVFVGADGLDTRKPNLEEARKRTKIRDVLGDIPDDRILSISNEGSSEKRQQEADRLLLAIMEMVTQNCLKHSHYTTEIIEAVQKSLEEKAASEGTSAEVVRAELINDDTPENANFFAQIRRRFRWLFAGCHIL